MADVKISQLPQATFPLSGGEVFPLVQNGVTVQARVGTAATVSALRGLTPINNSVINVDGYYTTGDGGGGQFYAVTNGTYTDNGGTIITTGLGVTASDAWIRIIEGPISVKWFGAKGDAVNDDTAAIAAACNLNQTVLIPGGYYNISSPITLTNSSVIGEQNNSRINLISPTAQFIINGDNLSIKNLTFIANAVMTVACVNVIGYKAFWVIDNIVAYNGTGVLYDGIKISNGLSGTISNCTITRPSNVGIYVTNAIAAYANDITLSDCNVGSAGVNHIVYENGINGVIIGCTAQSSLNNAANNFYLHNATVIMLGCYTEHGATSTGAAYVLDNCDYCQIISNANRSARGYWVTNTSASNYICGVATEASTIIYQVDAGCLDNTFFYGAYVPVAKIVNNGTRTTFFTNGGFLPGTAAAPGLRFDGSATAQNTGFYATAGSIGASANGVSLFNAAATNFGVVRAVASTISIQDTSADQGARFRGTTINGSWTFGPTLGDGNTFTINSPVGNDVFRINPSPAASDTGMLLWVNRAGVATLSQVSIGAADSGGAGYRVLRVAN